jgi:hypothetical protein
MRPKRPAGGDAPQDFLAKQPFTEEPSDALRKMNVDIARHNLQVTLKKYMDESWRVAKEVALEGNEENTRQMDQFVRNVYANDPRKLAEWEELISRYDFANTIESPE